MTRVTTSPTTPLPVTRAAGSTTPASPGIVKASAGSLAFTGLGHAGTLVAVAGAVLVLLGLCLYFFDVFDARRLVTWLLGL